MVLFQPYCKSKLNGSIDGIHSFVFISTTLSCSGSLGSRVYPRNSVSWEYTMDIKPSQGIMHALIHIHTLRQFGVASPPTPVFGTKTENPEENQQETQGEHGKVTRAYDLIRDPGTMRQLPLPDIPPCLTQCLNIIKEILIIPRSLYPEANNILIQT